MKGSIEPRGKLTWRLTVDTGRDESGKRTRHRETVKGTKREAERRLREILSTVETGLYIPPSKLTTGDYLNQWVSTYAVLHTSPRTVASYRDELARHVIPALGSIPLISLRPNHIQEYYVSELTSGRTDGKGGLSARTVAYHHAILTEALEYAVRQNELARNPAKLVDPPRPKRTEVATIASEDIPRFLDAATQSDYFGVFLTAIYTGARLGELLGLQWRNVDLDNSTMAIVATLYRTGSTWQLKEPKSARSRRQIMLPASAVAYLQGHKARLEAERAALGGVLTDSDFVFGQVDGKPRGARSALRALQRVLKIAGLPHVRFHDLRHTHASLLLKAGVNPKVVSERLGHGSVAFTLDTYSHVMPGIQESAAARFEALIEGEK